MKSIPPIAMIVLITFATPALAQPASRMLVSNMEAGPTADTLFVEITILHFQPSAPVNDPSPKIPAQLELDGKRVTVTLARVDPPSEQAVGPGKFGQAKYALHLPTGTRPQSPMILSLGNEGGSGYAFSLPDVGMVEPQERPQSAENAVTSPPAGPSRPPSRIQAMPSWAIFQPTLRSMPPTDLPRTVMRGFKSASNISFLEMQAQ